MSIQGTVDYLTNIYGNDSLVTEDIYKEYYNEILRENKIFNEVHLNPPSLEEIRWMERDLNTILTKNNQNNSFNNKYSRTIKFLEKYEKK